MGSSGDEMNMHLPQTHQSAMEVLLLASVPTQIVGPQASKPVIGLVQDNLAGMYRLSNELVRGIDTYNFNFQEFMALVSWFNNYTGTTVAPLKVDANGHPVWSARQLIGAMLPAISLKVGNVKIKNGKLLENFPPIGKISIVKGGFKNFNNKEYWQSCKFDLTQITHTPESIIRALNSEVGKCDINVKFNLENGGKVSITNSRDEPIFVVSSGYRNIVPYLGFKTKLSTRDISAGEQITSDKAFEIEEPPTFDKKIVGKSATNGLFHITWLDVGPEATRDLLDNISLITTQWLLMDGFSIGMSDMVIPKTVHDEIEMVKIRYMTLIEKLVKALRAGRYLVERNQTKDPITGEEVFSPTFFHSIQKQFELDMRYLLGEIKKKVESLTIKNLKRDNRMLSMANSGSKGSSSNAVQIISMLGQQEIEGGRVTDMLNRRPLPHYPKDTIDPKGRGFIDRSFMAGLDPASYWYHAVAGRMGVISTSIKTAETGYLQRKLIKVLEDLKIYYGYSVRNASGMIVQYLYGGDGFDASKLQLENVDFLQVSDLDFRNQIEITERDPMQVWLIPTKYEEYRQNMDREMELVKQETEELVKIREELRKIYYRTSYPDKIYSPINFRRLKNNITFKMGIEDQPQCEMLPSEIIEKSNEVLKRLPNIEANPLFESLYKYYMASKIIISGRLTKKAFEFMLAELESTYRNAIAAPGDAVGVIAAQSIGEPSTQMTLDTFHHTGDGAKANVSRGVPRIIEIVSLNAKQKTPSVSVYLNRRFMLADILKNTDLWSYERQLGELSSEDAKETVKKVKTQMVEKVGQIKANLEYTSFRDLVSASYIMYDRNDESTVVLEDREFLKKYWEFLEENGGDCQSDESNWTLRFELDKEKMGNQEIFMYTIEKVFRSHPDIKGRFTCIFSDDYENNIVCRFVYPGDIKETDDVQELLGFYEKMILDMKIKGVSGINKCRTRPIKRDYLSPDGALIPVISSKYTEVESKAIQTIDYVIDTDGSNLLEILNHPYVDQSRTASNNIHEVFELFGIEAARQLIIDEIRDVMEYAGSHVNTRHIKMLADIMTHKGRLISVDRHGMGKGDSGPLARASFEETTTHMVRAATFGEIDNMKGVSANAMFGQFVPVGTGSVEVVLDEEMLIQNAKSEPELKDIGIEDVKRENNIEGKICQPENFEFSYSLGGDMFI